MIGLETKLKMVRDHEVQNQRWLFFSSQAWPILAMILKKNCQTSEAVKSLKVTTHTKLQEEPISDVQELLMTRAEGQAPSGISTNTIRTTQSVLSVLKERAGLILILNTVQILGDLNDSGLIIL